MIGAPIGLAIGEPHSFPSAAVIGLGHDVFGEAASSHERRSRRLHDNIRQFERLADSLRDLDAVIEGMAAEQAERDAVNQQALARFLLTAQGNDFAEKGRLLMKKKNKDDEEAVLALMLL